MTEKTPAPQTEPQVNEPTPQTEPEVKSKCLRVTKGSNQYFGMIQGFDTRFQACNCEVIFLPTNEHEVIQAMQEIMDTPPYKEHFSIKGGGHCYENYVYNEQIQAIIDLSLMDKVFEEVDENHCLIGAEAGGTNWSLLKELYRRFGLAIPGGSCYSVGLGGHICGGGYGLLSRKFGLTIDHLSGVDIVCVDGANKVECKKLRKGSTVEEDQDLLWACKGGGGGNYGIITCYYFEKLPAPKFAYLKTKSIVWNGLTLEKFQALLAAYWDLVSKNKPFFSILHIMHISTGEIPFLFQYTFNAEEHYSIEEYSLFASALDKAGIILKESTIPMVGHPKSAGILNIEQELTWFEAAQTLNSSGSNQCGKYKSSYMRDAFPHHQSKAIYRYLTMNHIDLAALGRKFPDHSNPDYCEWIDELAVNDIINMKQSLVQVDSYGVKVNDVGSTTTAIPQRDSRMKLQYQTYWKRSPSRDITKSNETFNQFQDWIHLLWIKQMFNDVYSKTGGVPDPYYNVVKFSELSEATQFYSCANPSPTLDPDRIVDGCYYNYIDSQMMTTIHEHHEKMSWHEAKIATLRLYFENNLERLIKAKKQSDPNDVFKHGLSIPTSLEL